MRLPALLPGLLACLIVLAANAAAAEIERGTFGPFIRSLNDKPHGYAVLADPTGAAPAPLVECFDVRPGDCGRNRNWDDCAKDRERSELSEKKKDTAAGEHHWYGWSVYLPARFADAYPTKVTLGQFHQVGSHPAWMFEVGPTGYRLDDHVNAGRAAYPLVAASELKGRWHRIEIEAKWSAGRDGVLNVWADGALKVDHKGPTMTAERVYFKYGLYRSFLSRYKKAAGADVVPGQVVVNANVRRAETRDGLKAP